MAGQEPKDLAARFFKLFEGLDRSHGWYIVEGDANAKGKREGRRATVASGPTLDLMRQHLEGGAGLGVVPIRADNTCVFGAADIDVYPLDIEKLDAECRRLKLPLVTCRTKSGGAHLYLFLKEPAPAELVRDKLAEWAVALGYAGCEIFPKQVRLASEKDYGSWINLPYQDGPRTVRFAYGPGAAGRAVALPDPEEFLALAASRAVTVAELESFGLPGDEVLDDQYLGAPPCLVALARRGYPEGTRDNGLFNVAVYLRKRYGDGWERHLDSYNQACMRPPLPSADVVKIQKSVNKKSYSYRCKDQPICQVCDKRVCRDREFGVGGLPDDPGVQFGPLVKLQTQPPTYIWDVDGRRIELTTADLMDQRRFHVRAIEELDKWPQLIKNATWVKLVREKLGALETVEVPEDATREGQLWVHLHRFCTSRVVGKSMDELLLGKPYTDEGERITYFCAADFLAYLQQHRFMGATERELYKFLRKRGAGHKFQLLKGKGVNTWHVPAFTKQEEPFEVPQAPQEEIQP